VADQEELVRHFLVGSGGEKRADKGLPSLEERYRVLVEQIPAVVFMAYLDGSIAEAYVSPQIEQALGFSQEEWIEDPVRWYRQIHPDDKQRWSEEAAAMFVSGDSLRSAYRVLARDGRVVWFHCEIKMVRREDGSPWFLHGVGMDITDLKQLQELELQRQTAKAEATEDLLVRVVNSMSDALLLLDVHGRVVQTNRAAAALLGLPQEEVLGLIFSQMAPASLPCTPGELLRIHPEGLLRKDTEIISHAGNGVPVSVSCGVVRDKAGHATGLLLVARDITERKRAEMTEKLAATGRLAATIAHEINNPLEAVTNLIFLSKSHPALDPEVRQYLEHADQELARVIHIARQTLGFYRDTASPSTTRISELLDGILDLYGRKIAAKNLLVEKRYDTSQEIRGLLGEVRQVFSNLIANAIDASLQNTRLVLHVSLWRNWRNSAQAGIRVSIADQGAGIPGANEKRIFEPFFSTKRDFGTGLGLWVSKSLVEKHGGHIAFRSSTRRGGSGTVFSVFLPC
jgi:PAS domain S-box-containing protein